MNFYVADFNTAYHIILGRPTLAKFMAIPHYAYLVLKMPSPAGVLALRAVDVLPPIAYHGGPRGSMFGL